MLNKVAQRGNELRLKSLLGGYGEISATKKRLELSKPAKIAIAFSTFAFLLAILTANPVFLLGVPLSYLAVVTPSSFRESQRIANFDKDYSALLISLGSSVKAGRDPLSAFTDARQLFSLDSEMRKQLDAFKETLEEGATEEEAIFSFARDLKHPDLGLFRSAFLLARSEGSSLSECLHRLVKVTRQRQSFRRKISAAVAMQKMSAFGIAGCSGVICLIQALSNSEGFFAAIEHPTGKLLISSGAFLIAAGVIWMFRLTSGKLR